MVYTEKSDPMEVIDLKLSILTERITILEDFKNQALNSIEKLTKSVVQLLQKKETYENLVTEIEKIQGKLEIITDLKNQLTETTRTFSEEIGELRTMILDREKSFSKIEMGFEKINETIKEIEPRAITRDLEKKEQKILEDEARIEKLESFSKELTKQTEKVREVLDKIKSFENLVGVAKKVKKYLAQAEETKNYADRIAGKVETMFGDINNKVIDLDEKATKLEGVDSLLKELVPTVDKLQMEVSNKADKKDVISLQRSGVSSAVEERIDKIEKTLMEIQRKLADIEESKNQRNKELEELKEKVLELYPEDLKLKKELEMKIKLLEGEIEEIKKAYNNKEINEQTYKKKVQERKKEIEKLNFELEKYLKPEREDLNKRFSDLETNILRLPKVIDDRIDEKLLIEREDLNKRFSDLEIKILELSKVIEDRIDKKLLREKEKTRENISSREELTTRAEDTKIKHIFEPEVISKEEPKKIDKLMGLVRSIQRLIDSGDYKGAREQYIKLILEYEKHRGSNPKILMKITGLHNRLGY